MTRRVALGFTDGYTALEELVQRVTAGHHDYAIMLAGGLAISRKEINYNPDEPHGFVWDIYNDIDDSTHSTNDVGLWANTNIGEALDKRALLDMNGDEGLLLMAGRGWVAAEPVLAEMRAAVPTPANDDPLRYSIVGGPGALRLKTPDPEDAEWEPADPTLDLHPCDIGPATVAEIDLSATDFDGNAADTSIELTIEEIDGLIATLTALREDAIANRGFALRASGLWTNGIEEDYG